MATDAPSPIDRLVTAALVANDPTDLLDQAAALATRRRDRQIVAIATALAGGDADRAEALVHDHLADHPDDAVANQLAAAAHRRRG